MGGQFYLDWEAAGQLPHFGVSWHRDSVFQAELQNRYFGMSKEFHSTHITDGEDLHRCEDSNSRKLGRYETMVTISYYTKDTSLV